MSIVVGNKFFSNIPARNQAKPEKTAVCRQAAGLPLYVGADYVAGINSSKLAFKGTDKFQLPTAQVEQLLKDSLKEMKQAQSAEEKGIVYKKMYDNHIQIVKNIFNKFDKEEETCPDEASLIKIKNQKFFMNVLTHEVFNCVSPLYEAFIDNDNDNTPLPVNFDEMCENSFNAVVETYKTYQFLLDEGLESQNKSTADVFGLAMKSINAEAKRKNQKIKIEGSDELKKKRNTVFSNFQEYIVFSNILGNAVKYTPDNGSINVSFVRDKEKPVLNFIVEDTGRGIKKDEIEKVLNGERGSNTEGINGSGFGLNAVRKILEKGGTSPKIESELGKGTKITCPLFIGEKIKSSNKRKF